MYLKVDGNRMLVDCYAMCVALPFEYTETSYRSTPYYSMLGSKVKYLGIGMQCFFTTEKAYESFDNAKWYPLGIPLLLTSEPNEIETKEIAFGPGARTRKVILHTYFKGGAFLVNRESIKESDCMMMTLSRLEQGKFDFLTPEVVVSIINDAQSMNGLDLRIPSEETEIFVGERYRDPTNTDQKYRFHKGKNDPHKMVSFNTRTEMHKGSTYSALFGEDVQQGMINAIVRNDAGVRDQAGLVEALITGKDMDKYAQQDFVTKTKEDGQA